MLNNVGLSNLDKSFVGFLLTATEQELQEWMSTAHPEDISHCVDLLTHVKCELMDLVFDQNPDVSVAANYLEKIKRSIR